MNLQAELERFNPEPALQTWVSGTLDQLLDKARQDAATIKAANLKIQALTLELAHHRRIRFGNKSEAFSPEQRELFQETWDTDLAALEAEADQQAEALEPKDRPKRQRAGRRALPGHLPRIEHRHEPESCTCGQCGKDLVKIGEDIGEQLDVEPARFFVHRHIRPQYACRACETVSAAPIPPAVIDGGMAAVGLYVWVIISKYQDHLPLYRLEQIAARDQVILSRSTLAEWVGRVGVALQPLADRLAALLLERPVLHADETPVAQLDPGKGKTKRAYLWAYRSNALETGPPIVVFDYQTSRAGRHAQNFLSEWQGHLMVDDYSGYKALFRAGVTELGCLWLMPAGSTSISMRHRPIRLRWRHWSGSRLCTRSRIRAKTWMSLGGRNCDKRRLKPLLRSMHDWLLRTRMMVANGGGTAKAIDYSLKRWAALSRYAEDGRLPIDNNPVENTIRPIAIGKKNWLFTGSERAGIRAAAIQSLLATANLNGLDPSAWLRETLIYSR